MILLFNSKFLFLQLLLFFSLLINCSNQNNININIKQSFEIKTQRPIIGILTQPTKQEHRHYGDIYLSASYVKWLEAAGARIIAIPFDIVHIVSNHNHNQIIFDRTKAEKLFQNLNGLLFTGGSLPLHPSSPYYQTASFFFNRSIEAYKNGDYWPIWGTCQGFQLLSILAANDSSILQKQCFDSENLSLPLEIVVDQYLKSRLFSNMPNDIFQTLTQSNCTMNLHHDGIDPQIYIQNEKLSKFFRLLSTNKDRNAKAFGSTIEAYDVPIFGTQWHPERNQFEWDLPEQLDHSLPALRAMQYLANFFVEQTRYNAHKFEIDAIEQHLLISHSCPTFTGNDIDQQFPDQQIYFWDQFI
eukprot:TRINITY_DN758_c3_g1_i1.p1 TRINITY_DN758_c3_g1~~TRINITY_DN758_c3_g1_i1.p1  ORF type:complete len:356 (-),score=109.74 TRINITY_DN758_c3_g1_i1:132-1199(-)